MKVPVDAGSDFVRLGADCVEDLFGRARAVVTQLHQEVARIRLCDSQREASSGPARIAFNFRGGAQDFFDFAELAVGLSEASARRCEVVDNEAAFIHLWKEVCLQSLIEEGGGKQHQSAEAERPSHATEREPDGVLVDSDAAA